MYLVNRGRFTLTLCVLIKRLYRVKMKLDLSSNLARHHPRGVNPGSIPGR